jgi:hypothetical protein
MKARVSLGGVLFAVCLAMLAGVFVQARQLADLRTEQQRLKARAETVPPAATAEPELPVSSEPSASATAELLRLRNQVGQLTSRKRELEGARAENDRLREQLARNTNRVSTLTLPPDYIRKSQARWMGMSSPEASLESFLWAARNRDFTNLIQVLTPESGHELLSFPPDRRMEAMEMMSTLPGLRIVRQEPRPDGSIEMEVEFGAGTEPFQAKPLRVRQIDGQWRLDLR